MTFSQSLTPPNPYTSPSLPPSPPLSLSLSLSLSSDLFCIFLALSLATLPFFLAEERQPANKEKPNRERLRKLLLHQNLTSFTNLREGSSSFSSFYSVSCVKKKFFSHPQVFLISCSLLESPMSTLLEHDYIGLSEVLPSMESSEKISSSTVSVEERNSSCGLKYKETELRLGLPGSESPERQVHDVGLLKNFVSGSKRGFSDAIDVSGKWGFSGGGGSEVELVKNAALFSPVGKNSNGLAGNTQQPAMKEVVSSTKPSHEKKPQISAANDHGVAPAAKAQVVGWPPIRSFRKNSMATNPSKNSEDAEGKAGMGSLYVKVSMDGAPYLRKVDLKNYSNYMELSSALEKMFSCFTIGQYGSHGVPGRDGLSESRLMDLLHGSEYVLTYEDKDGDWMLVGDVPWEMFTNSCKRLRIMKGSEAIGLAPRAMEKCKNRN